MTHTLSEADSKALLAPFGVPFLIEHLFMIQRPFLIQRLFLINRLLLRRNNEIEVQIEIALADVGVLGTPGVELARFQGVFDMVGAFWHLNLV